MGCFRQKPDHARAIEIGLRTTGESKGAPAPGANIGASVHVWATDALDISVADRRRARDGCIQIVHRSPTSLPAAGGLALGGAPDAGGVLGLDADCRILNSTRRFVLGRPWSCCPLWAYRRRSLRTNPLRFDAFAHNVGSNRQGASLGQFEVVCAIALVVGVSSDFDFEISGWCAIAAATASRTWKLFLPTILSLSLAKLTTSLNLDLVGFDFDERRASIGAAIFVLEAVVRLGRVGALVLGVGDAVAIPIGDGVRAPVVVLEAVDQLRLIDALIVPVEHAVAVVVRIRAPVDVLEAIGVFRVVGAVIRLVRHAVLVAVGASVEVALAAHDGQTTLVGQRFRVAMPSWSRSGTSSGQPSVSFNPFFVSGSFGHLSLVSGIPSPSLSGSGQPSASWKPSASSATVGH